MPPVDESKHVTPSSSPATTWREPCPAGVEGYPAVEWQARFGSCPVGVDLAGPRLDVRRGSSPHTAQQSRDPTLPRSRVR